MHNEMQARLNVGMDVRTLDGKRIGHVASVHGDTFEVENGVFFKQDYAASFDEIAQIDRDAVVLALSERTLEAMRAPGGVGTALADRAVGAIDHARDALDDAIHAVQARRPKQAGGR